MSPCGCEPLIIVVLVKAGLPLCGDIYSPTGLTTHRKANHYFDARQARLVVEPLLSP